MNTRDYERARSALAFIPADHRDMWVRMGMAVKHGFGDEGFDLWDAWSKRSDRYDERAARDVWRSLNGTGGITLGTLFHEARARGWRDNGTYQRPTPEELDDRRRIAAERDAREAAEKARHAEAREKAASIWKAATPARDDHPYLVLKRIEAHGLRVYHGDSGMEAMRGNSDGTAMPGMRVYGVDRVTGRLSRVICGMSKDGCLVIPMRDAHRVIHSLQFIAGDGTKRFLPGGRVRGCYFSIGRPKGTICVCEGFASGATIRQATGHAVAVAFSAGNLKSVALALRMKFPEAKIMLCADNDRFTIGNPGVAKAREAALAVHGCLAVPRFDDIGPYDYYREGGANGRSH